MPSLTATHPFGSEITFEDLRCDLQAQSAWEDKYRLLIKLARKLPVLDEVTRQQAQEVKGCENRVWLGYQLNQNGTLHFFGDSEGRIVKGLLAILLTAIEKQTPQKILSIDFSEFFQATGLSGQLSDSRLNGIQALIQYIQKIAQENQ
ncbi:cysteine desulfurase sulfur acceptor subunit CsdE [Moellerella wisconsensis]|uniref:cysteine desulfurase sulfur acceptor subunit CsdE n=1 Tax=Moellerella wisconsensis TaxID=158849 RepID=UPI00240F9CF0|nr:cysteine desulfurase sulfur acceptor subunit CsdE [Moellerella wisconsensis]